jgi:hypothetical protein
MPEFATKDRTPPPAHPRRPGIAMHAGQCTICRHPQRAEIDRAFLDWRGPREIAREYDLGSHTTVYRHAHALGLFERRQRTSRFALGRLIKQSSHVKPTAASIVSAIRLMAKLNRRGKQVEETNSRTHDLPGVPPPNSSAGAKPESNPSGSAVPAVAQALLPVPARTASNGEPEKQGPNDEYNGPPIAFAQNAGPRGRKFFWR